MISTLENVASRITEREKWLRSVAFDLREKNPGFFRKVRKYSFSGSIGAVDGGLLSESYHGFELIAVRAVGVIFEYENGELKNVIYYPSALPDPEIICRDVPVEEEDVGPSRSLVRLKEELKTAVEVLEKYSPDYMFLDGSVAPLLSDRPRGEELKKEYMEVVELFKRLYCVEKSKICGIVKDPKGSRVCTHLGLKNARDVSVLFHAMRIGEYTAPLSYAEDPKKHPTLKDIGEEHAEKLYVIYMKCSEFDIPLRVEYYGGPEDAEEIAGLLYPLCSLNRAFTLPPFLIEADIRARLGAEDMRYIKEYVEKRLGPHYSYIKYRRASKW